MRRRVVITGAGCVTPLGAAVATFWDRLVAGCSGVGPIRQFDASKLPVRIAAEVRDWDMSAVGEDPSQWETHSRQTQFAVAAALQAGSNACLPSSRVDPARIGVYLGCGEVFPDFAAFARVLGKSIVDDEIEPHVFGRQYHQAAHPRSDLALEPGDAVGCIAGLFDTQGPATNYTTACVSSSVAIGAGLETVRRGDADVMFVGGAHSMIHPFGITGLHRLSALSERNDEPERASRPFDRDRDGFVIGEGGAILILEELEHARRRGTHIRAELRGYAATHDAFRITDPRPNGNIAARCIQLALDDARLDAGDVDYVNAHGSSTLLNDKAETAALKRALSSHAYHVPVSSTKSMTGHLTTACGAIETLACLLAVEHGTAPPTINYETPDPDCDLDYVPNGARDIRCRHALNANFGFGGHNTSLIVSRFEG